jgi:DNA-binding transcriptional LysR family regulator
MSGLSHDDIGSMALFARIVQRGSFSRVAAELGLAKSGLSRRIRELEARAGARLLNRSTRRLSLTEAGVRFYEHCQQVSAAFERASALVEGGDAGAKGVVRVSVAVQLARSFILPLANEFFEAQPGVSLDLRTDDRIVDLSESRVDVALRITKQVDERSLVVRRLASDRLVVFASRDYLDRYGMPAAPSELVKHRCLHFAPRSLEQEWRFKAAGAVLSIPVQSRLSIADDEGLKQAARLGLGLAIMPRAFLLPELASGELQTVLDGALAEDERGIFAVTAERRLTPPRVRAFVDFLAARLPRLLLPKGGAEKLKR